MRTNNKLLEELLSLIANIDLKKVLNKANAKNKDLLLSYINKEFLNFDEYKYLLSNLNLKKSDILELLYQLLTMIKDNNEEYNNKFHNTSKLIKYASLFGFTWINSDSCFQKAEEEFFELKEAIKKNDNSNIKEELGDLLFSLQCYADMKNYNLMSILDSANNKFEKRFRKVRKIAKLEKINIANASYKTKERIWKKAKRENNSS